MTAKSGSYLKALLAHYHPESSTAYLTFLPEKEREELIKTASPQKFPLTSSFLPRSWIDFIHYSWFLEFFGDLSSEQQALFFSALTEEQKKGISKKLIISPRQSPLPSFLGYWLSDRLKKEVLKEEPPSLASLPVSEMNELLRLTKAQLVHLIDLLGIYDLAAELRQIVDRTLLERIYASLSQEQLHFLHYCMKQTVKWVPPKLNITSWSGDKKFLSTLLHEKGLIRLAKSLMDEDYSLRWHLIHRLDTGRGRVLSKLFAGKQDPAMIPYFKGQVLHLAKRFLK